jgi:hypothetical protein
MDELFDSTSEVYISHVEDVDDFYKLIKVCYQLYKQNPTIFKIKFNGMVSDFKVYNYICEKCDGNKELIRSTFQYIKMFDYIYKQQLKSKQHNQKHFGDDYIDAADFAYQAISKRSGLTVDQLKRLIAKRNSFKQRVFKS